MYSQLKVQFYKLKTSVIFYLLIILFAVIGSSYGIVKFIPEQVSGGQVFLATISDTSFMFIYTLFIGYFIGSDFSNRTIQGEIQIGYSRLSVIASKWFVVLPSITLFHFIYVFSIALPCIIINGFGTEISVQGILVRILLVIFQIMAIQSFTFFIMFICKKSSLGIIVSVCFTAVTCNILRSYIGEENLLFKYTSFYRILMNAGSIPLNEILLSFLSAIITLIAVFFITYIAFRKAELK